MSLVTGVDVSHWQTPSAQLANQRASFGDRFAIVKATDGTSDDPAFHQHVAHFTGAGLEVGAYCFYRSGKDPVQQANKMLATTADVHLSLGLWLDYENASKGERPDDLLRFLHELEVITGRTPGLYTGPSWWQQTIGNDPRFERFPLWLAQYPNRYKDASTYPQTITPTVPAPWSQVSIWQFSDGAGNLDRNVCTADTFAALTGTHPTPPVQEDTFMPKLTDDEQADLYAKVKELHADYAVSRSAGTNGPKDNGSKRWQLGKMFNRIVLGKD